MTECRFHNLRPPNCRLFPIDERDLADRDMILPEQPCGFSFVPEGRASAERESWGSSRRD